MTLLFLFNSRRVFFTRRSKTFETTRLAKVCLDMSVKDWNLPGLCARELYVVMRQRVVSLAAEQKDNSHRYISVPRSMKIII